MLRNAPLADISHLRVAGLFCLQPLPFVWPAPAGAEYNTAASFVLQRTIAQTALHGERVLTGYRRFALRVSPTF